MKLTINFSKSFVCTHLAQTVILLEYTSAIIVYCITKRLSKKEQDSLCSNFYERNNTFSLVKRANILNLKRKSLSHKRFLFCRNREMTKQGTIF